MQFSPAQGKRLQLTKLGAVPAVFLAFLIGLTIAFNWSGGSVFNPPYLLLILNVIFLTGTGFAVAFISAKSYLNHGSLNILLLGSAVLIGALVATIAGLSAYISPNYNNAIYNTGILVSSALQLVSAVATLAGFGFKGLYSRKVLLTLAYIIAAIFVVLLTSVVLAGFAPAFLTTAGEPTLVRQLTLGFSVIFFAFSFMLFGWQYFKSKSRVIFLYSFALGLFAVGLVSAFAVEHSGELLTWLARMTLYVGSFYFVAAVLASRTDAESNKGLSDKWAEAFRSDRKQIATFFSKMLDGFTYCKIITDENGNPIDYVYLDVNDAFERITGLKKENILGKKVTDVIKVEVTPKDWISAVGRVAITGEPTTLEHYFKNEKKWIHISVYSPQKGYFISISEDITERKKAEEALKESEERFRIMADGTPGLLWVTDKEGKNLFANKYYQEYFQVTYEQVQGDKWQPFLNPEDKAQYIEKFVEATHEKKNFQAQVRVRRGDGEWRWLESNATPRFSKNGEFLGHVGISNDITERKRLEGQTQQLFNEVQQERDRLSSLLNSITDEVWFVDTEKKFTLANPSAIKEFKLNSADKSVDVENLAETSEVYRSDGTLRPVEESPPLRALKGEVLKNQEDTVRTPSRGELRYRQVSAAPVRDSEGNIIGSVSVVRDITELKQLQFSLQRHTEDLEKLVEERTKQLKDAERLAAIGATAGMVGHDIRNPLQAIIGDLYLAKEEIKEIPTDEGKRAMQDTLTEIENNIDYINKIVQDLQDYARPISPSAKETEIAMVCKEVLLKKAVPENIEASYKVKKGAEKLISDPSILKRILANLVNNAIQAMPNGGKLVINSYKEANDFIITVEDTGVGIPEEIKGKLFTPMFTTKSKGQGFGLAVVKRMTEALGGTVTFESQEGKGTTFTIRLPQSQQKNLFF